MNISLFGPSAAGGNFIVRVIKSRRKVIFVRDGRLLSALERVHASRQRLDRSTVRFCFQGGSKNNEKTIIYTLRHTLKLLHVPNNRIFIGISIWPLVKSDTLGPPKSTHSTGADIFYTTVQSRLRFFPCTGTCRRCCFRENG